MARKDKKSQETDIQEPRGETPAETSEQNGAEAGPEPGIGPAGQKEPAALEALLEEKKAEAVRNWDLYLRERADLENFRKRSQREKEEAIRFANDRLLKEIIPVLDNLERAVDHAGGKGDEQGLLEGVNMTIEMFRKALEDFGVKPIEAVGKVFDPNLHQAMGQMETDEHPPNAVSVELQKGYLLHDRLLRPSLVMVAKPPAAGSDPAGEPS